MQISLFLGVVCATLGNIGRSLGDFVMQMISVILRLALFKRDDGDQNAPQDLPRRRHEHILQNIPDTMAAAVGRFNLDGEVTVYAVCSSCHCTYEPEEVGNVLIYPKTCSNVPKAGSPPCGEKLVDVRRDGDKEIHVPIKTFLYHHFHDYLAGLLSRPDLEQIMDHRCDVLRDSEAQMDTNNAPRQSDSDPVHDIFDAEFLRTFKDHTGSKLFVDRPNGEGRYAFVLNMDFFNPEGMNIRGSRSSCGIISMACANLPLDIRYKPENMYLCGIIAGPKEPSLNAINHYLRPLIDDMVVSWSRGVRISKTASHPYGRLTRSAIIACVCDLPAARKLAAMHPPRSHFYCGVCTCRNLETLANVDFENWRLRDPAALRMQAEKWRDAKDPAHQKVMYEDHGVRWSEMWRLVYWDPSRQLVVDSMHCLLEGLAQYHIRDVLGLTTEAAKKNHAQPAFDYTFNVDYASSPVELSDNDKRDILAAHRVLIMEMDEDQEKTADFFEDLKPKLKRKNRKALLFVCAKELAGNELANIPWTASKDLLVNALIKWVRATRFNRGKELNFSLSGRPSP